MPTSKHRQRMKNVDNSFTGNEATEWLTLYLQRTGHFDSVSKEQVQNYCLSTNYIYITLVCDITAKVFRM